MNKTITILTLGLQIALTFIATFCIYMVFALLDNDFGFDGLFGLVIFQPIIAIILSSLTIFICLIVGLPIRLNNKLNYWWTTHFYISIIGTVIGLTFLLLALLPTFKETVTYDLDGQPTLKQIPNSIFSISGWLLTAFSLLHIYPPRQLTEKVKTFFKKTFKTSLTIFILLLLTNCNNSTSRTEKKPILKADREAPLGWVYLTIYQDSTFEFTLTGIRADKDVFKGKVEIRQDSLFFAYSDSIPRAGKTAIFNDKAVAYIDGEYIERLNISLTELTK
ncbi:MAG TPA: hypothetical protein VLZ83_12110 [Edaphocola sp.]|nr:hypothetical protein [Edaphocola sp.]